MHNQVLHALDTHITCEQSFGHQWPRSTPVKPARLVLEASTVRDMVQETEAHHLGADRGGGLPRVRDLVVQHPTDRVAPPETGLVPSEPLTPTRSDDA